ncbi:hypothetical protein K501DRAFT_274653 [Backusella circina FSU 941]|nr:hypothetical protein K501DRAFT_274653 [Backusella circina FSU 941]
MKTMLDKLYMCLVHIVTVHLQSLLCVLSTTGSNCLCMSWWIEGNTVLNTTCYMVRSLGCSVLVEIKKNKRYLLVYLVYPVDLCVIQSFGETLQIRKLYFGKSAPRFLRIKRTLDL